MGRAVGKERIDKISKSQRGEKENWKVQLEQMQMGLKILESEAASIPQKYGMTKESLEALLANPSNFSPCDWQLIEEARVKSQKLKEELTSILQCSQPMEKTRKKKSCKTSAKKHWIPLQ